MATYTKKLKTLDVFLMDNGSSVTIEDTETDDMATRALSEFKNYGTMHYVSDGKSCSIPYHAVAYIEVSETEATVEKADAYGC